MGTFSLKYSSNNEAEKVPMIESLFNRTYDQIINNKEVDIANWNELVVIGSKEIN